MAARCFVLVGLTFVGIIVAAAVGVGHGDALTVCPLGHDGLDVVRGDWSSLARELGLVRRYFHLAYIG